MEPENNHQPEPTEKSVVDTAKPLESTLQQSAISPEVPADTPVMPNPKEWFKSDNLIANDRPNRLKNILSVIYKNKIILVAVIMVSILLLGGVTYALILTNKKVKPVMIAPSGEISSAYPTNNTASDTANPTQSQTPTATTTPITSGTGSNSTTTKTATKTTNSSTSTTPSTATVSQTFSVSYTTSCYTPSALAIKKGDKVVFTNNTSNKYMWPASDPHPSHTDYPEFDAGKDITPGGTYSFTFTKIGSWGYHDHNKPNCHGTITVN